MTRSMELLHLARETKTALELAIAAFAPTDVIDRLAVVAGLLDAFNALALSDPTTVPLIGTTTQRAKLALDAWHRWQREHPPKATA